MYNQTLPSDTKPDSVGTFSFNLDSLPQDINDINNNLTLFIEEIGIDYPDLLLGESKILKVKLYNNFPKYGQLISYFVSHSIQIISFITGFSSWSV